MRNMRTIAILLGLVIAAAAFAAPAIQRLLPTQAEVKPWEPVKDGTTYVKRDNLEDIYNGGADLYRDNGIKEAVQQLYQRGNDIMEVTVMSIDSPAKAKKFYAYWKKQMSPKAVIKSKSSEGFVSSKNPVTAYVYSGAYVASVVPSYSGTKAQKDAGTFIKTLSKKLEKAAKK